MSTTVSTDISPFDLGELRCGNLERPVLPALRASAGSREPFVLTAREMAYILDTVPNVKRKERALHGRFGTQIFVLQGHG